MLAWPLVLRVARYLLCASEQGTPFPLCFRIGRGAGGWSELWSPLSAVDGYCAHRRPQLSALPALLSRGEERHLCLAVPLRLLVQVSSHLHAFPFVCGRVFCERVCLCMYTECPAWNGASTCSVQYLSSCCHIKWSSTFLSHPIALWLWLQEIVSFFPPVPADILGIRDKQSRLALEVTGSPPGGRGGWWRPDARLSGGGPGTPPSASVYRLTGE